MRRRKQLLALLLAILIVLATNPVFGLAVRAGGQEAMAQETEQEEEERTHTAGEGMLCTNQPDQGPSGTQDYVKRLVRDGNTVLFAHYDKDGRFYDSNPRMEAVVDGKTYSINTVCVRFDRSPGLDEWAFDVNKTEITDATARQLIYHTVDKLEYSMAHRLLCYWLGKRGIVNGIDFSAGNQNVKQGGDALTDQTATGYMGMTVGSFVSTYTSDQEAIPSNVTFHTYYLEHDTAYEPASDEWEYFQDFISWSKEVREPAKDYYVAFRKVDGIGNAVDDIAFSLEVTGIREGDTEASTKVYTPEERSGKAEGYPATGWYFDVTGTSDAKRWPHASNGKTAKQAKPYYMDSQGKQIPVPAGYAVVCLGSFEHKPTSVLVQEKMTEEQSERYIAKYKGAYDLARHGYVFTDVETAVERAGDAEITWRNYEVNYVGLMKESSDPAYVKDKDYYTLEKAEYQLFRYKDQAEKALADRNAGKPNYKNAVGKYVVKADGTADPIDVTRLMDRDQETGELLKEGTTFYVVESVAPENYKLSDRVASVLVTPGNTKENPAVFKVKDEPVILKGDIELIKHYDRSDSPLEGAVFEIENLTSHEKLQIVTDEDGYATTKREECPEGTLEIGAYQVTEIDAKGAQKEEPMRVMIGWEQEILPDGTVEWHMPQGGPKKGAVYRVFDTKRDNKDEVITDMPQPEMGTVAMAVDPMELDMVKDLDLSLWQGTAEALTREIGEQLGEGKKVLSAKEEVSLYDLCVVQNLRCDTDYTVVGTLMTVDAEGRVKPFTRPDGTTVTAKSEVIHTKKTYERSRYEACGLAVVHFEGLDLTDHQGEKLVVYERLYLGTVTEGEDILTRYPDSNNDTTFPLIHEDPEDRDQTVTVEIIPKPGIYGTQAGIVEMEELSKTHQRIHVRDSVFYQNLRMSEGISYTVRGRLMNPDGTPALINGREITGETDFVPSEAKGSVDVRFPGFDFRLEEGAVDADFSYVVYEELYENRMDVATGDVTSRLVGEHKDPGAKEQTVTGHLKRTPEEPEPEDTTLDRQPRTGDATPLTIFGILMGAAALGALIIIRIKKRK